MTTRLRQLFLLTLTLALRTEPAPAELPKAISVSPLAVAPGETATVAVHGLNLQDATELWTNLEADIQKVVPTAEESSQIASAFAEGKTPPDGTVIREAEDFDRGKFGKQGPFILNGSFTPANFAEWDFDVTSVGRYVLELNYAAGASRPVKLFLNGRLLTDDAASAVTGGFGGSDSRWHAECALALRNGRNTIRLERPGGTPHIDKLALVPTDLPPTRFVSITPSDRVAPFEFHVPENSPVGIRGLRISTREGISNLLMFMVDDLPSVSEVRGQNSGSEAQTLELPVAVEGYCDIGLADRYRFQAAAGESVSIEVVAARIGSRLDPVIRLLTADGQEIAFADDSPGLAGDCWIRHRFDSAGEYIVSIQDALMGGASAHRYRLRVGDFPLISSTVPAAIEAGVETRLTFAGPAVDGLAPIKLTDDGTESRLISARFPDRIGSGFSEVAVDGNAQTVIGGDSKALISVPAGISGILSRAGEQHACHFEAEKGDRVCIRDVSRSRGVPAILTMAINDASGRQLAQTRKAGPSGQQLIWSAPATGKYELVISDLAGRGGTEFGYQVDLSHAQPDFRLEVEQDSTILPQNGYALIKVTAARTGYNGPIALAVNGIEGVRLRNEVIREKAKDTRLKVYLPDDMQPGQTRSIQVTGTATINDQPVIRKARTVAAIRKALPLVAFPSARLNGLIALSVGPEIPDFFALSIDDNAVLYPRFVGEVYFTVRVKDRSKGYKDPVNIRIEGLPDGFSAGGGERAVSRSDNNEYRFQLRGPTQIDRGLTPLRIVAEASFKGQTKEVELVDVPLKIIDPLLLNVVADGPLAAGAKRKLTLKARRFVPPSRR